MVFDGWLLAVDEASGFAQDMKWAVLDPDRVETPKLKLLLSTSRRGTLYREHVCSPNRTILPHHKYSHVPGIWTLPSLSSSLSLRGKTAEAQKTRR